MHVNYILKLDLDTISLLLLSPPATRQIKTECALLLTLNLSNLSK